MPEDPDQDPTTLRLSVVVVNKDDERVKDTLAALSAPLRGVHEVLVVDASSGHLEHIRAAYPDVKWVDFVSQRGVSRTIAEQRNVGIDRSTGDVVAFLDASCVPAEGWSTAILDSIRSGERIVCGRIASSEGESIHDIGNGQDGLEAGYVEECSNMNVAFHREVFDSVGRFDEELGFAEDVDFAWRARESGLAIRFEPAALVRHDWGGQRENFARAFRYGVGRTRLYRKHRARRIQLLRHDLYISVYAVYTLLLPVSLVAPWYLLFLAVPLLQHRRSKPFETVGYRLVYSLGVWSEVFGVPVLKGQRDRRRRP
jgi:hypothetical protein